MTINIVQASGVNVVQGAAGYAIIYAASGPMGPAGPAGSGGTTPMTPVAGRQKFVNPSGTVTPTVPSTATIAIVVVEGGDARWSTDTTPATATEGAPIFAGETETFSGAAVNGLTLASQGGTCILWVYYFK